MKIRSLSLLLACGTVLAFTPALAEPPAPVGAEHGKESLKLPKPKAPAKAAAPAPKGEEADKEPAEPKASKEGKTPKDAKESKEEKDAKESEHAAPKGEENAEPAAHEESAAKSESAAESADADAGIKQLKEGNIRWVSGHSNAPNTDASRREETSTKGQTPFATIVTCSDSRVPVERVFDRGVGDIFVVRVAGNRAGDSETGTIEYGVGHLKTPLLVVMGHTSCGAVAAAVSKTPLHGKVAALVDGIRPAVDRARAANPNADEKALVGLAVRENVWQTVFDLFRNSPDLREAAGRHDVKIVGAVYDVATGKVEFLGEHPWQRELLAALKHGEDAPAAGAAASVHEHE